MARAPTDHELVHMLIPPFIAAIRKKIGTGLILVPTIVVNLRQQAANAFNRRRALRHKPLAGAMH